MRYLFILLLVGCGSADEAFDAGADANDAGEVMVDADLDASPPNDAPDRPDTSTLDAGTDAGPTDWRFTEVFVDYFEAQSGALEPGFRLRARCEYVGRPPEPTAPVWLDARMRLDGELGGRYVDEGAFVRCGDGDEVMVERLQLEPHVMCRTPPEPVGPPRTVEFDVWLVWAAGPFMDRDRPRDIIATERVEFDSATYCAGL